jgi:hypothetical protein
LQSLFSQPFFSARYGQPSECLAVRRRALSDFPTLHRDPGRGLQRRIFTACHFILARRLGMRCQCPQD